MLILWEKLALHLKKLEELSKTYPAGIDIQLLTPTLYVKTV